MDRRPQGMKLGLQGAIWAREILVKTASAATSHTRANPEISCMRPGSISTLRPLDFQRKSGNAPMAPFLSLHSRARL